MAINNPYSTSRPPDRYRLAACREVDQHGDGADDQAAEAEQHIAGADEAEGHQRHQQEEAEQRQRHRALDEPVVSSLVFL